MFDEIGEKLNENDDALLAAARFVLLKHYKPFWHMVAAAIRGRDGRIWTGIHLGATVGRMQVCAEAVALGRAVIEGDGTIACAVAVRHPKPHEVARDLAVVPPCGACREMMVDFDPDAEVIVPVGGGLVRVPVRALLPLPYQPVGAGGTMACSPRHFLTGSRRRRLPRFCAGVGVYFGTEGDFGAFRFHPCHVVISLT